MASQPIPPAITEETERRLTREEGWELARSMRGILKESYSRVGGAEEFHRKEREAWNEGSDSE